MEAMKPYIETGQGYTPDYKSYVSQEKIAGTDWTVLGVSSLEKLDQVRSNNDITFVVIHIKVITCNSYERT